MIDPNDKLKDGPGFDAIDIDHEYDHAREQYFASCDDVTESGSDTPARFYAATRSEAVVACLKAVYEAAASGKAIVVEV